MRLFTKLLRAIVEVLEEHYDLDEEPSTTYYWPSMPQVPPPSYWPQPPYQVYWTWTNPIPNTYSTTISCG